MPDSLHIRHRLLKRISTASVAVAISLSLLKFGAWWLSDSISLLASLMDSVTDILASGVNYFAVRYAMRGADDNHHYGHGKAESLSAVAQAMFIAGSSLFLIVSALPRLFRPVALENDRIGIAVMLISLAATAVLVFFQYRVLRQAQSQSVHADCLNYVNDLLTGGGVLAALILSGVFGILIADPLLAVIISLLMMRNVWRIIREAVASLMDSALPAQEMACIHAAIASVPGHLGAHRLRARRIGCWRVVDLHLAFPDDISLFAAHCINDQVEAAVDACFSTPCEVMIHLEPVSAAHDDRFTLQ